MGYAFGAHFARLAGVRIVAQLQSRDAPRFWEASGSTREQVLDAFAEAGAKAIIAEQAPPDASRNGWRRIGDTSHWAYLPATGSGSRR